MLKEDVLNYIMNTPHNTNWAVLKTLVGDDEELYKYITETPYNMNRAVLDGILDRIDEGGSEDAAMVGTAVVGTSTLGV